jgi:hypothetical protein
VGRADQGRQPDRELKLGAVNPDLTVCWRKDVPTWWALAVFPRPGIFITVLGVNLLGNCLRDLDPKGELNLR